MANFKVSDFKQEWIKTKIDEDCIRYMDELGLHLCDKKTKEEKFGGFNAVTTSQLRNIFSEVKRIDVKINSEADYENAHTDILLMRPKIAYATARVISTKRESKMADLRTVLEKGLLAVSNKDSFKRFGQFCEGIIAYHKVYGGRD